MKKLQHNTNKLKLSFNTLLLSFMIIISANSFSQGLFLPFIDDFSSYIGKPDSNLWLNQGVYINNGFQFLPPTNGVATLDILDSEGKIYEHANRDNFAADTLCSVAIRLDSILFPVSKKLSITDSVYLSFYFQPCGVGEKKWQTIGQTPSKNDSLVLQFYDGYEWNTVWIVQGMNADSIYKYDSSYFRYVLIPIVEDKYFTSKFRFRFINFASLDADLSFDRLSNSDQWNIDYIYLNINRSYMDNSFRDIAFVNPASSLLKNFTSIPAKHFKQEYMKDSLDIIITNLYSSTLNSFYSYNIADKDNNIIHQYNGGYENINSFLQTHQYQNINNHCKPVLDFSFNPPANIDSYYIVTHIVTEGVGQDNITSNDTIRYIQRFENYFAYDDGTSEGGIGGEDKSKNYMLAMDFPLLDDDTLYAVDLYFNATYSNANIQNFSINIFDATDEEFFIPNNIIYKQEKYTPVFDSLNKFVRYYFNQPVVLKKGIFFVALQPEKNFYFNLGFDQNNDITGHVFERIANNWQTIFLQGVPMIRPVFGYKAIALEKVISNIDKEYHFYPNPAKDYIYIDNAINPSITIYSTTGNKVLTSKGDFIDVRQLPNGLYFLQIDTKIYKLIIFK